MAKHALCIGINNYPGTDNDLSGCVNDAKDWKSALDKHGFASTILLDEEATKARMLAAIADLVRSTKAGDTAVLTYSGHGSSVPDVDGDEPDGYDEALVAWDTLNTGKAVVDDELYDVFLNREKGAKLVFISDSCHSGTVSRVAPVPVGTDGIARARFLPASKFLKGMTAPRQWAQPAPRARKTNGALLLAGCQDREFSYDASFNGRPNGAFTYVALTALKGLKAGATYRHWFAAIRESLPNRAHPQTPNLVGSLSQRDWQVLA